MIYPHPLSQAGSRKRPVHRWNGARGSDSLKNAPIAGAFFKESDPPRAEPTGSASSPFQIRVPSLDPRERSLERARRTLAPIRPQTLETPSLFVRVRSDAE